MKIEELFENRSTSCIVVDVQPEYSGVNDGEENPIFEEIIQFVNNQTGPVLMFVNAEDTGLTGDTRQDVQLYWEDSGFDPENWSRVTLVDKGYGYLRAWMDSGVQPNVIIKVIREMYRQRVNDSRQLFQGEDSETYTEDFKKFLGPDFYQVEKLLDDPLVTNWIEIGQLKRFNNSYIVGGGRNECLREVTLLCDAFNIKYRLIDSLVYG